MRNFKAAVLATATALPLLALSGASAADVEVVHWWTSGGEQAAVSGLRRRARQDGRQMDRRRNRAWRNRPRHDHAARARRRSAGCRAVQSGPAVRRPDRGRPVARPDAARREGRAGQSFIRPAQIKPPCKIDGKWWCVPVNIHMQNWAWASSRPSRRPASRCRPTGRSISPTFPS